MSVVISGMAICTPNSDTLDSFLEDLMAGRSSVTPWRTYDTSAIYSKIGGDLEGYKVEAKLESQKDKLPPEIWNKARALMKRVAWPTKITITMALDAWIDAKAGAADWNPEKVGVIVASNNINLNYSYKNEQQFRQEPDYIDPLFSLSALDTDHSSTISEVLGLKGGSYCVAGACASGNLALKAARDEILHHDLDAVIILGPLYEFSPVYLHALGLLGAISINKFNDAAHKASRPFDIAREGFVPSHSGGVLIVERASTALKRGATPYSEVVAVESTSDASRLPHPSLDGQLRTLNKLFKNANVRPEEITYVNAHATSTPQGDITEIQALKKFFGAHASQLKINAPKSILGHATGSAAVVETVAALMQMRKGCLHPSINIDNLDPEIDLDVCPSAVRNIEINYLLKNSFGFGGINCLAIHKRWP